jgi:murein DD-endopeptidase MepM/ murein hydrolase activator NlpD
MRRFAPIALTLAVALAVLTGSAHANTVHAKTAHGDTFAVIPASPFAVPSADLPNIPGSVAMPANLSTPPVAPIQLSYDQLLGLWQQAGTAYDIPWQVLAAINKVESNFGRNMGPSSAGAIGWMQFMPSTWLRWGVDANGDGVADPWNPSDAVYSAARYLAAAGGSSDLARAVYSYNHADWYVNEVLSLANLYGQGSGVAFSLDRLQQNLAAAEDAVAQASGRLVAARAPVRVAARAEAHWTKVADRARLLSDRLEYQKDAGLARQRRLDAQAIADRAAAALSAAQAGLVRARQASAQVSFAAGASSVLGAASFQNGWAFPVGGGPGVVSVAHTHHDYPAADIAAPAGSPVYAIAQSVVLRSWTQPDPACGIGLTLQTFDGQTWTYCHLSYLEPTVVPGASLVAGAPVGLVGSTGDATGPHLHLQLQPATAYPQNEAWFQSFAGTAFSWQDAATPVVTTLRFTAAVSASPDTAAAAGAPEFAVVPSAPAAAPEFAPTPVTGVVYFNRPRS